MDKIYDITINVICEMARIFVILRYCTVFFDKKKNKYEKIMAIAGVYFITVGSYLLFHNIWINLTVTYFGILTIMMLYKGSKKKKILFSIAVYVMCVLMDIVAAFFVMENPNANNQDIISSFLSVLLFLVSVIIIERINVKKAYSDIKGTHWIYLVVLSITSICSMLIIINDPTISRGSVLSITMVFVVINFIEYRLYVSMAERYTSVVENENLKNQLNAYEQQIQINIENEKQIRLLRHDMKHHLREIYALADSHRNDEIEAYIEQMIDSMQSPEAISESGNMSIDGVLNYMCSIAKEKGIETNLSVSVPENLQLNAYDFNIILGNLIENAIEASEIVEEPYIKVSVCYNVNCIFINVENRYYGTVRKDKKLLTTKGAGHGLGLESVDGIVAKYHGSLDVEYDKEVFLIKVTIFV